jgi:hypothetical protein
MFNPIIPPLVTPMQSTTVSEIRASRLKADQRVDISEEELGRQCFINNYVMSVAVR